VTCSLEPEENEEVVGTVLASRPGFARARPPVEVSPPLAERTDASGLVRVAPGPSHDGFSAILLTRLRR
jgi:16S rRNA C967 or C1407 C5-methylase (RsmB/RsmF family)